MQNCLPGSILNTNYYVPSEAVVKAEFSQEMQNSIKVLDNCRYFCCISNWSQCKH